MTTTLAPTVFPLIGEALQAHFRPHNQAVQQLGEAHGLAGAESYRLWLALELEPTPISVATMRVRNPYGKPTVFAEGLQQMADKGWLTPVGEQSYRLSEAGRTRIKGYIDALFQQLATPEPLPRAELERLATLTLRLVNASMAAPEPPGNWCLKVNRQSDRGPDAPVLVRINQYLTDLGCYRDDAHMAAWQALGVSGQAWELFSMLWRGELHSVAEVPDRMIAGRGFSREEYQAALDDLQARGWIAEQAGTPGRYELTPQGQQLRQQAEEQTDLYFYGPWVALSADELAELQRLLTRFRDEMQALVEETPAN
jgi:DNA-binding MarR family transcriptional regulator